MNQIILVIGKPSRRMTLFIVVDFSLMLHALKASSMVYESSKLLGMVVLTCSSYASTLSNV